MLTRGLSCNLLTTYFLQEANIQKNYCRFQVKQFFPRTDWLLKTGVFRKLMDFNILIISQDTKYSGEM